ncbi:MAG: hypothetical protein KA765_02830 [Thermoflexales bacterium]|nr:hypothetical protein [Thermoflexales bacterium]
MSPLVGLLIGWGLSGCLLYIGFAPAAPRWRMGLGLLGAGLAAAIGWLYWQPPLTTMPFDEKTNAAFLGLAISLLAGPLALIGLGLAVTLRGKRRLAALGLGILLPLVVSSISFFTTSYLGHSAEGQRLAALQADLNQHQALWQANHPYQYRFTVSRSLFCAPGHCPGPETVEVNGNHSTSLTVEDLYALIQTGIDQKYDAVTVTYHPELGYPLSIHTNPDWLVTDQSVFTTISDFQIIR